MKRHPGFLASLFDNPPSVTPGDPSMVPVLPSAPHNRTDTSIAAAVAIAPQMNRLEKLTLRIVAGENSATNEEIAAASIRYGRQMTLQCVCARANRLRAMGLLVDTGKRRRGISGRLAKVWGLATEVIDGRA